jgi:hypothetical protein
MGEVVLNFLFLVLSLTLAVVGTAVGAWLQHRSWKHQQWEKLRTERAEAALVTVERASALVDKRLYRQRRLLWAIRRGDPTDLEAERQEYRAAVFEWMDNLGRTKAELWAAFDRWTAVAFERDLHDRFARNGRQLEAALRSGARARLANEERELNKLGKSSYEFMQRLLERIQREDLNGLTGRYELSYRNWENLTSAFLWTRLFGLAPQR